MKFCSPYSGFDSMKTLACYALCLLGLEEQKKKYLALNRVLFEICMKNSGRFKANKKRMHHKNTVHHLLFCKDRNPYYTILGIFREH